MSKATLAIYFSGAPSIAAAPVAAYMSALCASTMAGGSGTASALTTTSVASTRQLSPQVDLVFSTWTH
ncbi:MAG: hypothetical protein A2750_00895 [Candidatus Yanofskybacteria bacterium RIFCSPHIGHO2_01_FULL_45_42]|uniref:Secreted protein n=1 Tax=Candidatus Yanofskybacteria bacterium RIFCSPHIGHO2_01_FULL_45_42 TaxID=1802671 RepID=A0A1F8F5F0_9BACT|nr:MAG: hypothetical protein A2750_00895 [Candidatus Yanofskybacteria bacterium RIFCSPHIGHO2_01_FULL_45_42]